jgi:MarR family transcriptional regulator, organic hydroperoxide resistance regulator
MWKVPGNGADGRRRSAPRCARRGSDPNRLGATDPGYRPVVPLPAASTALDDEIAFALGSASRAVTRRYRELLADMGLTYPQYLVMLLLWQQEDRTVHELGERLALRSGTLSPLLRRMAAAGLVVEEPDEADRRSVRVSLTDAGRAMRPQAERVAAGMAEAMGLDPAELVDFVTRLRLLTSRVRTPQGTPAAAVLPGEDDGRR